MFTRTIVRGYRSCVTHPEILKRFTLECKSIPPKIKQRYLIWPIGGGWMKHTNHEEKKELEIYGHCYDYGKADHRETMKIIAR